MKLILTTILIAFLSSCKTDSRIIDEIRVKTIVYGPEGNDLYIRGWEKLTMINDSQYVSVHAYEGIVTDSSIVTIYYK